MEKTQPVTFLQLVMSQKWFVFLLMFALGLLAFFSLNLSQATMFLSVNHFHHPMANEIFKIITWMGDWPFTAFVACICLFIRFKYAVQLVGSMLYTGLYTQVLKVIVQAPRPYVYFQEIKQSIYTIDHYTLENSLSFPSGHTTCVFSLAICLSCIWKGNIAQCITFFVAVLVAFSRVYLSQHFVVDLMAGSVIGTFGGLHFIWLLQRGKWYFTPAWNRGIIR
ncbi:phosphatase PAP2 family protein [Olivibacter sitiensis]|uniref:phosphatase PAP2 family protein n=1 Tax=Olivibacter sitiensis TaxID=376470 RepID=UPI0004146ED9|nr:phosphatase PAP2 family protein [Olivibacter sitiensis]